MDTMAGPSPSPRGSAKHFNLSPSEILYRSISPTEMMEASYKDGERIGTINPPELTAREKNMRTLGMAIKYIKHAPTSLTPSEFKEYQGKLKSTDFTPSTNFNYNKMSAIVAIYAHKRASSNFAGNILDEVYNVLEDRYSKYIILVRHDRSDREAFDRVKKERANASSIFFQIKRAMDSTHNNGILAAPTTKRQRKNNNDISAKIERDAIKREAEELLNGLKNEYRDYNNDPSTQKEIELSVNSKIFWLHNRIDWRKNPMNKTVARVAIRLVWDHNTKFKELCPYLRKNFPSTTKFLKDNCNSSIKK